MVRVVQPSVDKVLPQMFVVLQRQMLRRDVLRLLREVRHAENASCDSAVLRWSPVEENVRVPAVIELAVRAAKRWMTLAQGDQSSNLVKRVTPGCTSIVTMCGMVFLECDPVYPTAVVRMVGIFQVTVVIQRCNFVTNIK